MSLNANPFECKIQIGYNSAAAKLYAFDPAAFAIAGTSGERLDLIYWWIGRFRKLSNELEPKHNQMESFCWRAFEFKQALGRIGMPMNMPNSEFLQLPFPLRYWNDPWLKLGSLIANWEYVPGQEQCKTDLVQIWSECCVDLLTASDLSKDSADYARIREEHGDAVVLDCIRRLERACEKDEVPRIIDLCPECEIWMMEELTDVMKKVVNAVNVVNSLGIEE